MVVQKLTSYIMYIYTSVAVCFKAVAMCVRVCCSGFYMCAYVLQPLLCVCVCCNCCYACACVVAVAMRVCVVIIIIVIKSSYSRILRNSAFWAPQTNTVFEKIIVQVW